MESSHINTLEILAIQNQLLLSIGGTLNVRESMLVFMRAATKQLSLKGVQIYTFKDPTSANGSTSETKSSNRFLSFPDENAVIDQELIPENLLECIDIKSKEKYKTGSIAGSEITVFPFGGLGLVVCEKNNGKIQKTLKDLLAPIIIKLSGHYEVCMQLQYLNNEATINKAAELTYKKQAKRDPLTNLPNRRELHYSLSREISNAQRYNHYGALMYIDLDNFKNVNDSLGHSVGDMLLTLVARRLTEKKRSGDTVFRIGGDEFVYLLSNAGDTEAVATKTSIAVANRVIESLAKPLDIYEYSLHITPSIGIAAFPDEFGDGADSENVLRHADTAMYRAKKQGKNCFAFFNPEMHVEASKRLIIEDHLRKALSNDEFNLVYQPIIDINNNIIGAESLIRWRNPVLGNIPPGEFIGIAEESNLILELSDWITRRVCSYAESLYRALDKDSTFSYISINISPRQFIQNDFVESITSIIDSFSVPNEFIKLEFTENVLLDNIDVTIDKMKKLQEKDIDFLLDDFGTGYSSLSYLHKLPIKIIKIDKSFVDDIYSDKNNTQAIVNAILVMAEELGIKCIIEGVELEKQVEYFKQKGVFGMQGYYYYKPVSDEKLLKLVVDN